MQLTFFTQHSLSKIQLFNFSDIPYFIVRRYHNLSSLISDIGLAPVFAIVAMSITKYLSRCMCARVLRIYM